MIIFVNLFWICSSLMVPSIPTNYIKPKKPFSTTIFGKNLVFWKKNNTVTSLLDLCPHRFTQLSKGIITKEENIKCGYHGIEYNELGKATSLPHSINNKCENIKANYMNTIEEFELAWVDINLNFTEHNYSFYDKMPLKTPWYRQTVSIPFQLLLENAIDMDHTENTHHGLFGLNRYKIMNKYDKEKYSIDYYNKNGFRVTNNGGACIEFMAPFHTRIDFILNRFNVSIIAFCVPQNISETNFMSRLIITPKRRVNKFILKSINFLLKITTSKKLSKSILDQDVNQIDGILKNKDLTKDWKYPSFTYGDSPVILMNKWFREYYNVSNY